MAPSTKVFSFYRKEPFEITMLYADPSSLPGAINPLPRLQQGIKDEACLKLAELCSKGGYWFGTM